MRSRRGVGPANDNDHRRSYPAVMDCLVALAATIKPVVARLDRAIQYAATSRLSQKMSLEYWVAWSSRAMTAVFCANGALHSWSYKLPPDCAALHSGYGHRTYVTTAVPIPTLKIWNQDIDTSQNCTGCSRESGSAFDPPIGARGLDWGFCTALVPRSRPHLFSGGVKPSGSIVLTRFLDANRYLPPIKSEGMLRSKTL